MSKIVKLKCHII